MGNLDPKEAIYASMTNFAQVAPVEFRVFKETLKDYSSRGLTRQELRELVDQRIESLIPIEIKANALTIYHSDYALASATGWLNSKGLLLTELDVLGRVQAKERVEAIASKTPIVDIIQRQEEDKAHARKLGFKEIMEINASGKGTIKTLVDPFKDIIAFDATTVVQLYQSERILRHEDVFPAGYKGEVRAYVPWIVDKTLQTDLAMPVRNSIFPSMTEKFTRVDKSTFNATISNTSLSERRKQEVVDWYLNLEPGPIAGQALPPFVGTGDGYVMEKIHDLVTITLLTIHLQSILNL